MAGADAAETAAAAAEPPGHGELGAGEDAEACQEMQSGYHQAICGRPPPPEVVALKSARPWILACLFFLSAFAFVLCAVLQISACWLFVLCLCSGSMAQPLVYLGSRVRTFCMGGLLTAGFSSSIYCLAVLVVAPGIDAAAELIGSLTVVGLTCTRLLRRQSAAPSAARGGRPGLGCCCAIVACGLISLLLLFSLVDAILGLHSVAVRGPERFATRSDGVRVAYSCEGEVRSGTIVVIEPGYGAPAPQLFWVRRFLSNSTRTCVYDVPDVGFSSKPASYGFQSDASSMRAIFDREFAAAGVEVGERVAVAAGHSRGAITAQTFRSRYGEDSNSFAGLLTIAIDGTFCTARWSPVLEEGVGMSYSDVAFLATFVPLLSGAVRLVILASPAVRDALICPDCFVVDYDMPAGEQWAFFERLLGLHSRGYGRSLTGRSLAWDLGNYDGPDQMQCYASRDDLYISADLVCQSSEQRGQRGRICAEHVSLITNSGFAREVAKVADDFLRWRVFETAVGGASHG